MKAIFYSVFQDDAVEHEVAFPTLQQAKEHRAILEYPDGAITKIVTADLPLRQLLCSVFNRECFAAEQEEIMPALPETPVESS